MFLRAIAHWEVSLHGVELVPSMNLRCGQRHCRTVTNALKGDLLNMGRNVMEASVNEGTLSINGVHGHVHRQLVHC